MQHINFTIAQLDGQLLRSTIAGLIDSAPNQTWRVSVERAGQHLLDNPHLAWFGELASGHLMMESKSRPGLVVEAKPSACSCGIGVLHYHTTAAYIARKVKLEMEARTITMPLAITTLDLVAA